MTLEKLTQEVVDGATEFTKTMEKAFLLIGQVFNFVSYYRRRNVLIALTTDRRKVQDVLTNKTLEEDSPMLFGPKFEEQLDAVPDSKKKKKGLLNMLDVPEEKPNSSSHGRRTHGRGSTPFRGGPLSSNTGRRCARGRGFNFSNFCQQGQQPFITDRGRGTRGHGSRDRAANRGGHY